MFCIGGVATLQTSSSEPRWVNNEERDVLLPWIEAKEETKLGHPFATGHDNRADGKSGKSGYPWGGKSGGHVGVSGVRNNIDECPSGKSGKSRSYTDGKSGKSGLYYSEGKSGKSGRIRPYEGKSGKSGGQVYKIFKKNGGGVSLFRYFMHA